MSETVERGPLRRFEVTWENGHVEYVMAHQCLMPMSSIFGEQSERLRWKFHGEVDGRWGLVLAAPDEDIRSVRDVTVDEVVTP